MGGGRPARRPPPWCGSGGQWGGASPYLGPSLCLPWAGNKAGVFGFAPAMEGVAPISLWFMLVCCSGARSVWRPRALARVCLSITLPAGAVGSGRGGGPCGAPPPWRRGPSRGRGGVPLPSGGWGAGAPVARGSVGGSWETGGGSRRGSPPSSLEGGGLWPPARTPLRRRRILPRCTCLAGVVGQPRALGGPCSRRVSPAGGGGLCAALPGGVAGEPSGAGGSSASVRPSAFPGWAAKRVGDAQVMEGVAPILPRLVFVCRPRAWSVRRPCALARVCPPVAAPAGAGGGGRGDARRAGSIAPPPGRCGPFGGREDVLSASGGGWRAGASVARRPEGGVGGRGLG